MRVYPFLHFIQELGPGMGPESGHQFFGFGFAAFGATQVLVPLADLLYRLKIMGTFNAFINIDRHFRLHKNVNITTAWKIFITGRRSSQGSFSNCPPRLRIRKAPVTRGFSGLFS
jgi:hypothetical protein